jgi:putative NADH-flavin reductase
MRVTIFGANGPAGRLTVARALDAGHHVVAFTRRPHDFPQRHSALSVVGGDVQDAATVREAVRGSDAVLSTLGVPFSRRPVTVYSIGAGHIIEAMRAYGVKRLAVVTSSATEPHHHADGGFMLNWVLQPLITATIGKTVYADMRRMEALVRSADLEWTILRPSGLFDLTEPTAYHLDEDRAPGVYTARADLAAALVDQLADDRYVRRVAAVTTVEHTPTLWSMIRREATKS